MAGGTRITHIAKQDFNTSITQQYLALRKGYQGGSLALACKGAVPQAAPVSRGKCEWGTQRLTP